MTHRRARASTRGLMRPRVGREPVGCIGSPSLRDAWSGTCRHHGGSGQGRYAWAPLAVFAPPAAAFDRTGIPPGGLPGHPRRTARRAAPYWALWPSRTRRSSAAAHRALAASGDLPAWQSARPGCHHGRRRQRPTGSDRYDGWRSAPPVSNCWACPPKREARRGRWSQQRDARRDPACRRGDSAVAWAGSDSRACVMPAADASASSPASPRRTTASQRSSRSARIRGGGARSSMRSMRARRTGCSMSRPGTGMVAQALHDRYGCAVVGLIRARTCSVARTREGVFEEVVEGRAERLPLTDAAFDHLTSRISSATSTIRRRQCASSLAS